MSNRYFLQKKEIIERLKTLARSLLEEEKNIQKIILFGSLAEDRATIRSDADIMIVTEGDPYSRWSEWILYFTEAPLPVDVIPVKKENLKRLPLARKALRKGVVLAERNKV